MSNAVAMAEVRQRFPLSTEEKATFCEKHNIRKLSLFGSVLRDDYQSDSDIDVLVEFDAEHIPGLFGFSGMELELSDLLGERRVDLNTLGFLCKYFRDEVVKEAELLYDKG